MFFLFQKNNLSIYYTKNAGNVMDIIL